MYGGGTSGDVPPPVLDVVICVGSIVAAFLRHASASLRVPGYGKVPSLRDDADVAMAFLQPHFGGSCVCRRCHGVGEPTPC